jgi:hypothetical protein
MPFHLTKWHEAMVNDNIENIEMSHEESVCYCKRFETLEKIRRTNGAGAAILPVGN